MANVLLVRASHDLATLYLAEYSQLLIDYAQQQGHQVKDLYDDVKGSAARLLDFEAAMQSFNPDIAMLFGHANKSQQTGQDLEVLLQVGVNDDVMSGKSVYLGSCLAPEQEIVLNSEIKPIVQVKIGDKVLTHEGRYQEITKIFERSYNGDLYTITSWRLGVPSTVTAEHPILAIVGYRCKRVNYQLCKSTRMGICNSCKEKAFIHYTPEWIKASCLTKNHFLVYPIISEIKDVSYIRISDYYYDAPPKERPGATNKIIAEIGNKKLRYSEIENLCEGYERCRGLAYHIQKRLRGKISRYNLGDRWHLENEYFYCKSKHQNIADLVELNNNFLELSGYYIAEGSVSLRRGGTISFTLHERETEIAQRIVDLIKLVFGLEASIKHYGKHSCTVRLNCKPVTHFFKALFGTQSPQKKMPHWFLKLPIEKQSVILKALNLGDGYFSKGIQIFNTSSKILSFQVIQIAMRLGIMVSLYHGPNAKSKIGIYEIRQTSKINGSRVGFFFENFFVVPVKNIEKTSYQGKVYNIAVKDDNSFVTLNSTLHNCSTGIELGPSMVSKTAQFYAGYQADFVFVYNPNFETRPLDDPWAKAFFDCMLATGYAILLGKTPKEVYDLTIQRYDYWWNYWIGQNDPMADDILTWLNWDRSSFIALTPTGLYGPPPKLTVPLNLAPYVLPLGIAAAFFLLSRNDK